MSHSRVRRALRWTIALAFLCTCGRPAVASAAACKNASSLRLVVLRVDSYVDEGARSKYDFLIREVLSTLRGTVAPNDRDFDYLSNLHMAAAAEGVVDGEGRMAAYFRGERTDVLQLFMTNILVEGQDARSRHLVYLNQAYIGPDCGLAGTCLFFEKRKNPPSATDFLMQQYLAILTLYALGIDAERVGCEPKVPSTLFQSALRRIADLEHNDLEFKRMLEVRMGLENRLATLAQARP